MIERILPRTAVLEMTYRCNHQCVFCSCPWFADRLTCLPEIEPLEWFSVIDDFVQRGVKEMTFTGGEPLLKNELFKIIAHAVAQNISTHLLSNGRIMSDDCLAFCREHDVQLSMSLPGLKTFHKHTDCDTDVKTILDWFAKAHQMGVKAVAGITVTSRNIGELFETIAEALLEGADSILLNRFMPGGRGLQHRDLELNRHQLTEMLDTAEEVLRTANRFGTIGTELPRCLVDPSKYEHLRIGTRCSAAVDFFVIDPSGYIRVCKHSEKRLLHWREINQLLYNPYWQRFVNKDFLPPTCMQCELSPKCDGGCREAAHIIGGQLNALDPLLIVG